MLNFSDLLLGCEDTDGGVNILKCCISTTVLKTMCYCIFMAVLCLLTATCGLESEGNVIEFPCNSV